MDEITVINHCGCHKSRYILAKTAHIQDIQIRIFKQQDGPGHGFTSAWS